MYHGDMFPIGISQCGKVWASDISSLKTAQRPIAYSISFICASCKGFDTFGLISCNITGGSKTGHGRRVGLLYGITLHKLPAGKFLLPIPGRREINLTFSDLLDTSILDII